MFTVEQIKNAHSKVKTGADFPKYIQAIKQLGVHAFETWVSDSHTVYFSTDGYQTNSEPLYENLEITNSTNENQFNHYLKIHQKGQTNYVTFCQHCAGTGIEKWFADLNEMTCTYFDKAGNKILVEQIPG
ncbi:MAG: DUF1398 family protein [Ginsengibacter sp.]